MPSTDPSDSLMHARKSINSRGSIVIPGALVAILVTFGPIAKQAYDVWEARRDKAVAEALAEKAEKDALVERLEQIERKLGWLDYRTCLLAKKHASEGVWRDRECERPGRSR